VLRPYQQAALDAIDSAHARGVTRVLVVMPTGTGKTVVFAGLPDRLWYVHRQMLVLVHREELVNQAVDKISHWNPLFRVDVEMAERFADPDADVIVASVPTLHRRKRLTRFDWSTFSICVVDEAHHATADSYKTVLQGTGFMKDDSGKLLVGVTATPNRSDGKGLGEIFQETVFDYPIGRAVVDGFLCDLKAVRAKTDTDISSVKVQGGDFALGELAEKVNTPKRNDLIVKQWCERGAGRRTIVFCTNIKHSQDLAETFVRAGVKAAAIWGDDPDRAEKLASHKVGELQVLCNCAVLTEGYDDPAVACILLARPTKSALLYRQMVGRGTRICDGKADCLIVDIVDASSRHELCEATDLVGLPKGSADDGESIFKAAEDAAVEKAGVEILRKTLVDAKLLDDCPSEIKKLTKLAWRYRKGDGYCLSVGEKVIAEVYPNISLLWRVDVVGATPCVPSGGLREALAYAEFQVRKMYPQHLGLLFRAAKWHSEPASPGQVKYVENLMGKKAPQGLTKAEAGRLIQKYK
jgi:ATP-dependent helicase IRC3